MFRLFHPSSCDPPHRISHPDKLVDLTNEFAANGWSLNHPVLIGYVLNNRVQLLSGTHRHGAAQMAGLSIPVLLRPYSEIQAAWGTDQWQQVMDAPLLIAATRYRD